MTNANLQPATKWLAERAGYVVEWDKRLGGCLVYFDENGLSQLLPGRAGHFDTFEVGMILSWLAKTGYSVMIENEYTVSILFVSGSAISTQEGVTADTLEQALTQAVIALHESEGGDA